MRNRIRMLPESHFSIWCYSASNFRIAIESKCRDVFVSNTQLRINLQRKHLFPDKSSPLKNSIKSTWQIYTILIKWSKHTADGYFGSTLVYAYRKYDRRYWITFRNIVFVDSVWMLSRHTAVYARENFHFCNLSHSFNIKVSKPFF